MKEIETNIPLEFLTDIAPSETEIRSVARRCSHDIDCIIDKLVGTNMTFRKLYDLKGRSYVKRIIEDVLARS